MSSRSERYFWGCGLLALVVVAFLTAHALFRFASAIAANAPVLP